MTQITDNTEKWFNAPVTVHEGTLTEIRSHIPDFERRCFSLTQPDYNQTQMNKRLDTIVRKPFGNEPHFIPVGVVSKDYVLVSHKSVLDEAIRALKKANIQLETVKAALRITEYGERMALSLYLPKTYDFDPGDGYPMALRLECFNSVDGSTRFRALMGWFRLVCSNGLVIGITRSDIHRRHIGNLSIEDIGAVLSSGLQATETEIKNFVQWRNTPIVEDQLNLWIEEALRETWGFKAATRAYHIFMTGYDVDVIGPYKGNTPATIPVLQTARVPGAPEKSQNGYDVSQILAWIAKERRDIQEQLEWKEQIPELLRSLALSPENEEGLFAPYPPQCGS